MQQTFEELGPDDLARLGKQREWVRDHYDVVAREQYNTVAGKLRLLDTIIRSKWIDPTETWKLQCLGITFGDVLVQEVGLAWIAVEDSYGRDPALRDPGSPIILYPLTTISQRVERGDDVDVYTLLDAARQTVERLRRDLKGNL